MDFSQIADLAPVLLQVLLIDLVLAGDNAVVIGLAVNGFTAGAAARGDLGRVGGATVIRIGLCAGGAGRCWR